MDKLAERSQNNEWEGIKSSYDRLHRTTQHYESLIYSSTAPVFAICVTLLTIALGAGDFGHGVQITAAIAGLALSTVSYITIEKLRAYIDAMTVKMKDFEQETNLGLWRGFEAEYNRHFWSRMPSNMQMRALVFACIVVAFICLAAFEFYQLLL